MGPRLSFFVIGSLLATSTVAAYSTVSLWEARATLERAQDRDRSDDMLRQEGMCEVSSGVRRALARDGSYPFWERVCGTRRDSPSVDDDDSLDRKG